MDMNTEFCYLLKSDLCQLTWGLWEPHQSSSSLWLLKMSFCSTKLEHSDGEDLEEMRETVLTTNILRTVSEIHFIWHNIYLLKMYDSVAFNHKVVWQSPLFSLLLSCLSFFLFSFFCKYLWLDFPAQCWLSVAKAFLCLGKVLVFHK